MLTDEGRRKIGDWIVANKASFRPGRLIATVHPMDLRKLLSSLSLYAKPKAIIGDEVVGLLMTCGDCLIEWDESVDAPQIAGDWSGCPVCLGIYDLRNLRAIPDVT